MKPQADLEPQYLTWEVTLRITVPIADKEDPNKWDWHGLINEFGETDYPVAKATHAMVVSML